MCNEYVDIGLIVLICLVPTLNHERERGILRNNNISTVIRKLNHILHGRNIVNLNDLTLLAQRTLNHVGVTHNVSFHVLQHIDFGILASECHCSLCNSLIGIHCVVWAFARKETVNGVLHSNNARATSNHQNSVNVLHRHVGILHTIHHHCLASLHKIAGYLVEFIAGNANGLDIQVQEGNIYIDIIGLG